VKIEVSDLRPRSDKDSYWVNLCFSELDDDEIEAITGTLKRRRLYLALGTEMIEGIVKKEKILRGLKKG